MLSKSAEYALRALHCLAHVGGGGPVTTARLAERVGVPENYLSKLLHRLQKEGVVLSRRGRGGGFALARPPGEIPLAEVVEPFDDVMERRCLLGRSECRDDDPCAAHEAWRGAVAGLRDFFLGTSLEDLGAPTGDGPCFAPSGADDPIDARRTVAGGRSDER